MFRSLIIILFINLYLLASPHSVHNQITKLTEDVEVLKNENQKRNLIKELDSKIDRLDINNKEVNIVIKNDLKRILTEVVDSNKNSILKENIEKEWTPSDWGTIIIAILTIFLAVSAVVSAILLWKQNKEQKIINNQNLSILSKQQEDHQQQIRLNQIENQMMNTMNFLRKKFIEKERFYYTFLDNYVYFKALEKGIKKENLVIEKKEELLIVHCNYPKFSNTYEKANIFTYINSSLIDLGIEKTKELINMNGFVKAELNTFVSQLSSLVFFIEESLKLGFDRMITRDMINTFSYHSSIAYKLGFMDDNLYLRLKAHLIHNLYSTYEFIIEDDIRESILYEINIVNKHLEVSLSDNDIEDIVHKTYYNESKEIFIYIEVILLNHEFNLQKDESKKWVKVQKNK